MLSPRRFCFHKLISVMGFSKEKNVTHSIKINGQKEITSGNGLAVFFLCESVSHFAVAFD